MADLTAVRNQVRNRATFAVSDSSRRLESTLKATSPRKTGELQGSTTVRADGLVATARATATHASFVREGTRPHVIRPKRGRLLSFYWPVTGRQMFLPRVNHPGTRSNDWWDRGLRQWQDFLADGLRRAPN